MWERYNLSAQQSMSQGKQAEAEATFRLALQEAEKIGPHDNKVAITCLNLANCLTRQGKYAEAEQLYKRTVDIKEKLYGPLHHELISPLENFAKMLRASGREPESIKLEQKAHGISRKNSAFDPYKRIEKP